MTYYPRRQAIGLCKGNNCYEFSTKLVTYKVRHISKYWCTFCDGYLMCITDTLTLAKSEILKDYNKRVDDYNEYVRANKEIE